MKKRPLLFFGSLLIAATAVSANAIEVYWTGVPIRPTFIVVGTLADVRKEALVSPGFTWPDGRETVRIHDVGWINVERVLYGASASNRLPISWVSDVQFLPPRVDVELWSEAEETHSVGERHIWVLWRRDRGSEEFSTYFDFQDYPMETLSKVKRETRKMRRK